MSKNRKILPQKDGVILWSRDIAKSLRFNPNVRSGENVGSANVSY